jgi:DNA polymerase III sliding clamp (beta) subunit (PCNA family)
MLDTLKFVQGAVSKKDYVPALTYFRIRNQRITGFNGKISLSAPLALDLDCLPKAQAFVNAVEVCSETVQLNITASNKLRVRSGKFTAHVELLAEDTFPEIVPEGRVVAIKEDLLPALRLMYEFTAEDAAKPWASGLLLDGRTMTATNNVIIVQHHIEDYFPFRINIPRATVREMLRINESPTSVQVSEHSVSFHYPQGRWLRSQVNAITWPDVDALFTHVQKFNPLMQDVSPELFDALEKLKPFVGAVAQIFIRDAMIATAQEDGASVDMDLPMGSFNLNMLLLLKDVATKIALAAWPQPVPFFGHKLRGVIAGMRM